MSYVGMLKQRCNILALQEIVTDGQPVFDWGIIEGGANVLCFLDLGLIRPGKDPVWTPEAGRAADRTGVLFVHPKAPIKTGHRVVMLKGPSGVFSVESAVDEIWTPRRLHHLEVGVKEVGRPIALGAPTT